MVAMVAVALAWLRGALVSFLYCRPLLDKIGWESMGILIIYLILASAVVLPARCDDRLLLEPRSVPCRQLPVAYWLKSCEAMRGWVPQTGMLR